MNKILPSFEVDGEKYEIKKTRWLIAEYNRLNEENPISDENKASAAKATSLVEDVRKFSQKENEWWEKLSENPTEENQKTYLMFKKMSDDAIQAYNDFVVSNNVLEIASKHNIDILEKIAIKALAEQYFGMNEKKATETWEKFVDSQSSQSIVVEWLTSMAQCLFIDDEEETDNDFLIKMRKQNEEKASRRAFRRK